MLALGFVTGQHQIPTSGHINCYAFLWKSNMPLVLGQGAWEWIVRSWTVVWTGLDTTSLNRMTDWVTTAQGKEVRPTISSVLVFVGLNPGNVHSTSILKKPEARKRLISEAFKLFQATESTTNVYLGEEEMRHPVRKTLTSQMPASGSKVPETKGRAETRQSKDLQTATHMSCSQDFCNGRGTCIMEGKLRKCRCLVEYGGEFCQEAGRGPVSGYVALGGAVALSAALAIWGLFLHSRRERKFKRWVAMSVFVWELHFKGSL